MTETLEELSLTIREIKASLALTKANQDIPMQSPTLNELFAALAKAQGEMEIASREKDNTFFKSRYAILASLVKASRPYLTKNGLSVTQRNLPNGNGAVYLSTILGHSSGQWIESRMLISPVKTDIQAIGSYITYLRRYCYASIVGVTDDEDDDDDGNSISLKPAAKISGEQFAAIRELLDQFPPDEEQSLLKWAQITDLANLSADKFSIAMNGLKTKMTRKKT